ncbi:hypothetical protein [Clostridium sp. JS66]|uniref:hypothetical protein n=1 Tax=Clostridium sp. JS66 TaxID=3064705 RepID=UPI00298DE3A4|nr:hypothetical protein [Clostridium sp. JS66]WPC44583.1 hypothetical protein Q6H37_14180 [Clostridium sp. JS66]
MDDIVKLLVKSRLFCDVGKEKLSSLFYDLHGTIKYYYKGETILGEDDIVNYIGVILHGSLFVTKLFLDGEHSIIEHLKPLYMVAADIACYSMHTYKEKSIFHICKRGHFYIFYSI